VPRYTLIALLVYLAACHFTASAQHPVATRLSAQDLLTLISTKGPDSVAHAYGQSCGAPIDDSAATGDSLWLLVVHRLYGSSDGCLTEVFDNAITMAMAAAPARVLHMFPTTPLSVVCTLPRFEAPDSTIKSFYTRATRALRLVSDTSLTTKRDHCQRLLRIAYAQRYPSGQRQR
jgi:hypothetical protein